MNILERIAKYFYNRVPVVCFVCNTPHARKSMQYERNNMNNLVPLCPGCHTSIFKPFSKGHDHG